MIYADFSTSTAMWVRFKPVFRALYEDLYVKKSIGEVQRMIIDFGNKMPLDTLPTDSRLKDPKLGAGALLDIGVCFLAYASFILGEGRVGKDHPEPSKVVSSMSIVNGIDESNFVVLEYPPRYADAKSTSTRGKSVICSSTFHYKGGEDFARIEGSDGEITLFGIAASVPGGYRKKSGPQPGHGEEDRRAVDVFKVERPEGTLGFFWEADAVAQDVTTGRRRIL